LGRINNLTASPLSGFYTLPKKGWSSKKKGRWVLYLIGEKFAAIQEGEKEEATRRHLVKEFSKEEAIGRVRLLKKERVSRGGWRIEEKTEEDNLCAAPDFARSSPKVPYYKEETGDDDPGFQTRFLYLEVRKP